MAPADALPEEAYLTPAERRQLDALAQPDTTVGDLATVRLADFIQVAWPIVEPAAQLVWNWHIDALCDHLQAVTEGEIRNLLVNIPPGSMKSLVVSVFWPAWVWIRKPSWRVNCWTYADDLSVRDSIKCRSVVRSDWYQRTFVRGAWKLSDDQDRKDYFQNTRFGFRTALTVGGASTGFRGDAILIDDPLNAKDADSKAKRQAVLTAYDQGIGNRLNDLATGTRVVIMQRLHAEDLSGHLLRQGGWEHLCLPSEFEPKRRCVTHVRRAGERVKFFEDPRRGAGDLLFEERFPREVLGEEKRRMGSQGYAGQHQQAPAPPEGIIFKRAWFRRWHRAGEFVPVGVESRLLPERFDEMLISVDASFKDTDGSDNVAMGVWGRVGIDKFLVTQVCRRMDFPETLKTLVDLMNAYPRARPKLIEDKANGPAVISVLKKEVSGIVAVNPEGGKESRAHAVSPQVEAGEVYVPLHADWVNDYLEEMATFPKALHDDQVDQTTQALLRFAGRRSSLGTLEALATS